MPLMPMFDLNRPSASKAAASKAAMTKADKAKTAQRMTQLREMNAAKEAKLTGAAAKAAKKG